MNIFFSLQHTEIIIQGILINRALFSIADCKTAYISSFYQSVIPGEHWKGNMKDIALRHALNHL